MAATRRMIDRTKERFNLQPENLAADTAYGSGGMLGWLMQRGIEPHIPVLDRSSQTKGMFTHRDFTFVQERNLFICPGGKELAFVCRRSNDIMMYRARQADCANCALKSRCTTGAVRNLSVNAYEQARRHVAALAETEAFKKSARLRRKVEMLFAHLKRNLNFRRLRLRGMTGARDECVLAATAQNLRKLVKLIGSSPPPLAEACA